MLVRTWIPALVLLLALPAAGESPPAGPSGDPPGGGEAAQPAAEEPDPALARDVLACRLLVLGKAVEVRQVCRHGEFGGEFRFTFRIEKVLKGALGPVMALAVVLPAGEMGAHAGLVQGVMAPEQPAVALFLDEGDRMRCPPVFRLLGTARPAALAAAAEAVVKAEIGRQTARLLGGDEAERAAASQALAGLGTPALPELRAIQESAPPEASEWARTTVLAIHNLLCDPCRVVQRDARYPFSPVPVYGAPDSRDTLFRLAPGSLVFRYETWSSHSGSYARVRIPDGREGWIEAEACGPAGGPGE